MSRSAPLPSRVSALLTWPFGIGLTSWNYMWRTTPMHRSETAGSRDDAPPTLPAHLTPDDVQPIEDGVGPLYHRRYAARIAGSRMNAETLLDRLARNLNAASPTSFARFHRLTGEDGLPVEVNDELLVLMPGPWNGPVRVLETTPASFGFATLDGHLEAGQIHFRAHDEDDTVHFEIESWTRSGDTLSNVLYTHLRMAKEVQLHMWTSFIEKVADVSGGRLRGGIAIETHTIEDPRAALA